MSLSLQQWQKLCLPSFLLNAVFRLAEFCVFPNFVPHSSKGVALSWAVGPEPLSYLVIQEANWLFTFHSSAPLSLVHACTVLSHLALRGMPCPHGEIDTSHSAECPWAGGCWSPQSLQWDEQVRGRKAAPVPHVPRWMRV